MQPYANLSGGSGVVSFEIGNGHIVVQFRDGWKYKYTFESAGTENILEMQRLALAGQGLNSFISKHVRKNYSEKWK